MNKQANKQKLESNFFGKEHKIKFKEKSEVGTWSKVVLPYPLEPRSKCLIISSLAHPLPQLWHLFQLWDDSQQNKEPYHLENMPTPSCLSFPFIFWKDSLSILPLNTDPILH